MRELSTLTHPWGAVRAKCEARVRASFDAAGVQVDGSRPSDIRVHDPRFYNRVVREGSVGLGESYVDGWWDAESVDALIARLLDAELDRAHDRAGRAAALMEHFVNPQTRSRASINARRHYDIGNDLFEAMLDRRMVYTCAYWDGAADLDDAQTRKLDLVCRKLGLQSGMTLLDVGCGWGGLAAFAAERYGARVTGVTVSPEQVGWAREHWKGLPVDLRLCDYRDLKGRFDRIASLGMFEHVGWRNYRAFMETMRRLLAADGVFLLQSIGGNRSVRSIDPWIHKYIFPNAMLPSIRQIAAATEGLFVVEDWQNLGAHYDRTLMAWFANFEAAWSRLRGRYDARFRRTWRYYLQASAGSFRCRHNQLWQIVFTAKGMPGGFHRLAAQSFH